jgi:hypothetical protein
MKIERNALLTSLASFARSGSGLVIGGPGAGKTYLVSELSKMLEQEGMPNLQISVDALGEGTDSEIQEALELDTDLVSALENEPVNEGILILDGYDAARNERTQRNILELIRKAKVRLLSWRVIVVVRTFDAQKSPELGDLFLSDLDASSGYDSVPCRHFVIPPLDQEEIRSLEEDSPRLFKAYSSASNEFKALLRIPFNLWLLEKILPDDVSVDFRGLTSQVQLLGLFWARRVRAGSNGLQREHVVTVIVEKMVAQRNLSVKKKEVFDPVMSQAWDDLFSGEVLIEQTFGGRARFGHNILFDYAVSILMLEEDPASLVSFLRTEPSRQLFLRPSFVFYFARLWHENQDDFWRNYTFLIGGDIEGRLLGRLVPPTVLVQECDNSARLEPLLLMQDTAPSVGPSAAQYALRSLRTWEPRSIEIWVKFLKDLTAKLSPEIAWEVGLLIEICLNKPNPQVLLLGEAARGLMDWIWTHRSKHRELTDAILGRFGVSLVAKTFSTDPKGSRATLQPVLELVKEANFPIEPLYQLAANLAPIVETDPELVGDVYRTIFRSEESSESKTKMGGSTVLVMTSTRRQDFGMCHYLLIEFFPKYLKAAFQPAVRAGIDGVNSDVMRKHVDEGEAGIQFSFRGGSATYIADDSVFWGVHNEPYEPTLVLGLICSCLDEMLGLAGRTKDIEGALDAFRDRAQVALFWKRLLALVAKHPNELREEGVELCASPAILSGRDTLYEVSAALSALAPVMTHGEMERVELTILSLGSEDRRKRLISQIPAIMIVTPDAKDLRAELEIAGQVVPNTPLVTFQTYTHQYTKEDWLKDKGVDLGRPANKKLRELDAALSSAINPINKPVFAGELEAARDAAVTLWSEIEAASDADEHVSESAWVTLGEYSRFVLTNVGDPHDPLSLHAREVIAACGQHPSPRPSPTADSEYTSPVWGSSPRTEAAQLLPVWIERTGDGAALELFMRLVEDPSPEVRFLSAHELWRLVDRAPSDFWSIIRARIAVEVNDIVLQGLLDSIGRVIPQHEQTGVEALSLLRERALSGTAPRELSDLYSDTVMWLVIVRQNSEATRFLEEILDDPVKYSRAVRRAAFDAGGYIAGRTDEPVPEKTHGSNAAKWLVRIVDAVQSGLSKSKGIETNQGEDSPVADLYRSINTIITALWVARHRIEGADPLEFYTRIKPVLSRILEFAMIPDLGTLAPSTAHHAMEFLNKCVAIDPRGVLKMAWQITSRSPGYNLDPLAVNEVVKMVEVILADHRDQMREPESLQHLLDLLDIFAETGWSEALRIVWRLDEVFR